MKDCSLCPISVQTAGYLNTQRLPFNKLATFHLHRQNEKLFLLQLEIAAYMHKSLICLEIPFSLSDKAYDPRPSCLGFNILSGITERRCLQSD